MLGFELGSYLKDLETIVNIDSGHFFEEGTNKVADFYAERYKELGLSVERLYSEGDTASPVLRIRNSDSERIDVLFVAHMDTVFPVGTAKERPFSVDADGLVHGPGCLDCKGGTLAVYYLIKSMIENSEVNFNFCIIYNSDEEKGSRKSRAFIEQTAQISDRCLIFEPGRANEQYVLQRKGGANYVVRCYGIPAHSGVEPEKGASAIVELAKWIPKLQEEFFRLDEGTTINIGRFSGGGDNGSVPDYAEFTISFRYLIDSRLDDMEKYLDNMVKNTFDKRCRIEVEHVSLRPAMFPHEKTMKLLDSLRYAGEKNGFPIETVVTGGGSDGNFIAHYGVATLDGCGPSGSNMHTDKEYLVTKTLETRLDVMHDLLIKEFTK